MPLQRYRRMAVAFAIWTYHVSNFIISNLLTILHVLFICTMAWKTLLRHCKLTEVGVRLSASTLLFLEILEMWKNRSCLQSLCFERSWRVLLTMAIPRNSFSNWKISSFQSVAKITRSWLVSCRVLSIHRQLNLTYIQTHSRAHHALKTNYWLQKLCDTRCDTRRK